MSNGTVGAFWSYAHEDNRLDGGSIVGLANNLANEFSLNTGRELELFVDCDSLEWGNEWRKRIDGALVHANFFLPIITPRYFQRNECRKEALAFHAQSQSLGFEDLMLPILYAPVSDFEESDADELKALMSRYQHVDWRGLRLESPGSFEYRKAVHRLAMRLIELETKINQKRLVQEIVAAQDDDSASDAGVYDVMKEIEALLPDWIESLESRDVSMAQSRAVSSIYSPRLLKLEAARPGNFGAVFAVTQKFAKELLPLAERFVVEADVYAKRSVELDPLMLRLLHFMEQEPGIASSLDSLRTYLMIAKENIAGSNEKARSGSVLGSVWARKRAHMSRLVKQLADTYERAEELTSEGNALVEHWIDEWERVTAKNY